jgi:polyvinyl alcohol dehydrogenase (cytochrome)
MVLILTALLAAQQPPPPLDGRALFEKHCTSCHASNDPRIPTVEELRERPPQSIVNALTTGAMRLQGSELSEAERRAIAEYLAGKIVGVAPASASGACVARAFDPSQGPQWSGWSPDATNTRLQPAAQAGLTAADVPKLRLKWAFGFPNATSARALPTIAGGRVFVGSQSGLVYSLDAKSGCTFWAFQANGGVRTAIVVGPRPGPSTSSGQGGIAAYFGDSRSNVYAIDPANGSLLWSRKVEDHPSSHVTGTPTLHQNRLYVTVSSGEEGQGGNASYSCCTFRGSVLALDAATGAVVWKTYTIAEEPKPIGKNAAGAARWGPSGAGIWSSPTVDAKRRLIYAATGNMYTEPQQTSSDAVMAFDMDSGKIVWTAQVTPRDVFVTGCGGRPGPNCPPREELGPDFDFGNSPMLVTLPGGRDLIVIGQKSGVGWALDPDKRGAIVWQYRAGRGSALGGMEFGSAADSERAYFPVADGIGPQAGELHAVRLDTGERVWTAPPQPVKCASTSLSAGQRTRGCSPGILAAISVVPGLVFAGAMDGGIRAYSTKDGSVIWEYDTNREFETVNGVPAKGASINGPGPTIAGGMVFVNSGYGALGGRAGNVLLAFGIE